MNAKVQLKLDTSTRSQNCEIIENSENIAYSGREINRNKNEKMHTKIEIKSKKNILEKDKFNHKIPLTSRAEHSKMNFFHHQKRNNNENYFKNKNRESISISSKKQDSKKSCATNVFLDDEEKVKLQ